MAKRPPKTSKQLPSGLHLPRLKRKKSAPKNVTVPDVSKLPATQQRALIVAVIIALLAGFFLVRAFASLIILSILAAVVFYPLYVRLVRRLKRPGTAALLTFLILLLVIIIPLTIIVLVTVGQVQHLIDQLQTADGSFSISSATNELLQTINKALASLTRGHYQISAEQLSSVIAKAASNLASFLLKLLTSSFSSIAAFVTEFILFIYLFSALLLHAGELIKIIRALNPLGDEVATLYLSRTAEMARGVVAGQFVIAVCQGLTEAVMLYLVGIPYFFFWFFVLTLFSIVPLGGGILAIPIGIILVLTGQVWQGLFVLIGHFLIITNIDNVLRPRLIPRSVRMNSALMMLAVFGGIAAFGFLGIAVGPVLMILITSTIELYVTLAAKRK